MSIEFEHPRFFPRHIPHADWQEFSAEGFRHSVTGVVYRGEPRPTCGMPVGGLDTGCLDIEPNGMLGYVTIFNELVAPRGLSNMPFMGYRTDGATRLLVTDRRAKEDTPTSAASPHQFPPTDYTPRYRQMDLSGVEICRSVDYWGHYPVLDMEFDTGDSLDVGMRAFHPFLPGDDHTSLLPGAVFRVRLRNRSDNACQGVFLFSLPGFTVGKSVPGEHVERAVLDLESTIEAVRVNRLSDNPGRRMEYALGVVNAPAGCTWGAGLDAEGGRWAAAGESLPAPLPEESGLSVRIPFALEPGSSTELTILLAWHAPTWMAGGTPAADDSSPFVHMYERMWPDLETVLQDLASCQTSYLDRVIAWQEVLYQAPEVPGWLADSLINNLHLLTECSVWAQEGWAGSEWVPSALGLFALNECPRGCPQLECLPCSFYGNIPLLYFFPDAALSTLHGYRAYQFPDGRPPWIFGGITARDKNNQDPYDMAAPDRGYQTVLNGACYIVMADRYWRTSGDDVFLAEFWESLKRCNDFALALRPAYGDSQVVAMPEPGTDAEGLGDTEWFEAPEPGWKGYVTHAGGIRLAQVAIMRRMALAMDDSEYVAKCDDWLAAGGKALDEILWNETCYWNFREPDTDTESDLVFGYQLDGHWITSWHGVDAVFPPDRVSVTLQTIRDINCSLSQSGAVNYANPDGTVAQVGGYGPYSYFPPELFMLAMTYMYEGNRDFGSDLLHRCLANVVRWGYVWDFPNTTRGDADTGQRTFGADYYQNLMLWAVPAALAGSDMTEPQAADGLVQRMLDAAQLGGASS